MRVFLFAKRFDSLAVAPTRAEQAAGIAAHPRAKILAACAAQFAASPN